MAALQEAYQEGYWIKKFISCWY